MAIKQELSGAKQSSRKRTSQHYGHEMVGFDHAAAPCYPLNDQYQQCGT